MLFSAVKISTSRLSGRVGLRITKKYNTSEKNHPDFASTEKETKAGGLNIWTWNSTTIQIRNQDLQCKHVLSDGMIKILNRDESVYLPLLLEKSWALP